MRVIIIGVIAMIAIFVPEGLLIPRAQKHVKSKKRSPVNEKQINPEFNKDVRDIDLGDLIN